MMTLGIRKLIVVGLVGAVLLLGNFILVANWLQEKGIIDWAKGIRKGYLTGTAITIIVVLMILLVAPRREGRRLLRRCPGCAVRCNEGTAGQPSRVNSCRNSISWCSSIPMRHWSNCESGFRLRSTAAR